MSKTHELNPQAEGRIGLAIQRLAERYPFHCRILERFKVQPRPSLGTMAVTVAGDDVLLLYNADFVLGITLVELAGVLKHEVNHVLFGHILADPADYPDHDARVIARHSSRSSCESTGRTSWYSSRTDWGRRPTTNLVSR